MGGGGSIGRVGSLGRRKLGESGSSTIVSDEDTSCIDDDWTDGVSAGAGGGLMLSIKGGRSSTEVSYG